MSSADFLNVSSLLSDLTGSVCLDYFKNPKTLNCQHSFCNDCLERKKCFFFFLILKFYKLIKINSSIVKIQFDTMSTVSCKHTL